MEIQLLSSLLRFLLRLNLNNAFFKYAYLFYYLVLQVYIQEKGSKYCHSSMFLKKIK